MEENIKKMQTLEKDIKLLAEKGSLSGMLGDVDKILDQLLAARESIAAGMKRIYSSSYHLTISRS